MIYNYKVRGECFSDVLKLLTLLFEQDHLCKVTSIYRLDIKGVPIPDTVAHFSSSLDRDRILGLLREEAFPEAHVMRRSLKVVE